MASLHLGKRTFWAENGERGAVLAWWAPVCPVGPPFAWWAPALASWPTLLRSFHPLRLYRLYRRSGSHRSASLRADDISETVHAGASLALRTHFSFAAMSTPNPIDRFLLQEVESASPAKLHWLLLRRAHSLAVTIADLWKVQNFTEAQQWIVLVRDILNELLEGIVDPNHPLARQQSDLYVFLSALLATAEHGHDQAAIEDLREILEIEMASWELLVLRESCSGVATYGAAAPSLPPTSFAAGSLDFSA